MCGPTLGTPRQARWGPCSQGAALTGHLLLLLLGLLGVRPQAGVAGLGAAQFPADLVQALLQGLLTLLVRRLGQRQEGREEAGPAAGSEAKDHGELFPSCQAGRTTVIKCSWISEVGSPTESARRPPQPE